MDAVELVLPEAVVAVSKLMGSEGFSSGGGGDAGAAVGRAPAGLQEGNSVMNRPSFDACSHRAKIPPEPAFQFKVPGPGRFVPNGQPSNLNLGDASEELKLLSTNASQSLTTSPEAKQLHGRSGKVVSRSNSVGSKRSRIVQLELSTSESGLEDMKGSCSGLLHDGHLPQFAFLFETTNPKNVVSELKFSQLLDVTRLRFWSYNAFFL